MKTNYILIALAIIAALTMVSCKNNNKKAQSQEPTQEEVQEMKQALADTILAQIDEIAERMFDATSNSFKIHEYKLTEAEKMVKPDYLLDPSVAATLVTRSQKINALAIYSIESLIRQLYDMPVDDVREVISKLAVEVNSPLDVEYVRSDAPVSEKAKKAYEICMQRGDLQYFWQFEEAFGTEISYLLVMNPDLFFSKITEEQWQGYYQRRHFCMAGIRALADYDEEIAALRDFVYQEWTIADIDEASKLNATIASAKEYRVAQKDLFIAKRNALLQ